MGLPRSVVVITAFSLLLALLLAVDAIPFMRGGFGWQWPFEPAPLRRALPLAAGIVSYLLGAWVLLRREGTVRWLLLWAFLGATVFPLAVIALRSDDVGYELFARTVSGVTTGPHLAAAEMDWSGGAWRDWPAVMNLYEGRSVHVRLSPPGLPMWYGLLNAIFEKSPRVADVLHRALLPYQCHNWNLLAYAPAEWASAWLGILMPAWAAFTVVPLYAVARRLIAGQARVAVLWWPLIPALAMFTPSWNTLYPLFSLLAFWLLLIGLERARGEIQFIAAGLLTGLLTFANFSLIPLIALFGIYTILHFVWRQNPWTLSAAWRRSIKVGAWFVLGLAIPWMVYWLVTSLTPPDLLRVAMGVHLALDRPYLPWLWLHFWEWALFTGIPLIALWLFAAWRSIKRHQTGKPALAIALLLTLALLLLSGTARGETGRVWLFFAPFVLIAAAGAFNHTDRDQAIRPSSWLAIAVGQGAIMAALAMTWAVIDAPDITPRPAPPGGLATARPVNAVFDAQFQLVSWDAQVEQDAIILRLDWQGIKPMTTPYWFSALLVSPEGTPLAESVVWQPLETRYPTTCWMAGERVGDTVTLPLPDGAPKGEWWISLAAFADTQNPEQRLIVTLADGTQDTQVGLGPVRVD